MVQAMEKVRAYKEFCDLLLHSYENKCNQCVYIDEYFGYLLNSTKSFENLCMFANVYFWFDVS